MKQHPSAFPALYAAQLARFENVMKKSFGIVLAVLALCLTAFLAYPHTSWAPIEPPQAFTGYKQRSWSLQGGTMFSIEWKHGSHVRTAEFLANKQGDLVDVLVLKRSPFDWQGDGNEFAAATWNKFFKEKVQPSKEVAMRY